MRIRRIEIPVLIVLALSLAGCSEERGPTAVESGVHASAPDKMFQETTYPERVINGYRVRFDGRSVGTAGTTFAYTVTGTGAEPALSHFTVEIPDCTSDPVAWSPTNSVSVNYDPNAEIYGIDWHLSVAADDTLGRSYSVTFPGDVPLGEVRSAVWSGNAFGVGVIPGPCAGYDIAGRVFTDANEDGVLGTDEPGLGNVVVELVDADGLVQTVTTDAIGDYTFRKAPGNYTIRIPTDATAYPGAFNGQLGASFDPTTPLSAEVRVGPDSPGNDFGFHPQTQEIILDLQTGALLTDGESVKYWIRALRSALNNSHPPGGYDPQAVVDFVSEIDGLLLADPYDFDPGFAGVQQAFDLLKSSSKEPIDILLRELLATELNHVSGRGLIGQPEFQLALIGWGESLVANAWAGSAATATPNKAGGGLLSDAATLFKLLNTGGGGSPDE